MYMIFSKWTLLMLLTKPASFDFDFDLWIQDDSYVDTYKGCHRGRNKHLYWEVSKSSSYMVSYWSHCAI
jgi:hypothetical protein